MNKAIKAPKPTRRIDHFYARADRWRELASLAQRCASGSSDRETVDTLRQLFARTRSGTVQNAIAGVLIRADRKSVAATELLHTLRENRVKTSPAGNMVDALIHRLQESS